jgi:RNA polymerase sigma factor (sigma-70 family)
MTRIQAQVVRDRRARRVDDLDSETLRSVQYFLAARADRRGLGHDFFAAWERFYLACDPLIRNFARRRSDLVYNHEDRVQDIWRIIVIHLDRYDPRRGLFSAWLRCVVRHGLNDQDRSHRIHCRLVDELERQLPSREADPAHVFESGGSRRRVELVVDELRSIVSETNYRIVHDHWVEGMSFAEIALTLGFTAKQVRDRHHRALEKLRELLWNRE